MLRDVEKSLEAAMSIKERDSLDDDEATTGSLTADEVPADSSINCSVESTKGDAQDSNDDDKKEAIEEEPRDDAVESDAFRIREGEANIDTKTIVKSDNAIAKDGCDGEQTVENSEENKPNLSHSSESYPSPLSSKVNDVMGKVCVLFSPVFKLSHSNTAIKSQPFITLHPSYIRSVKSEDLLFALDELMKLHSSESHSFLSDPGSSSWIEVVRAACNHPASDTPSVPLYMLLLLRFQIAVFDSFRMAMAGNATEVHKEASADNKTDAKKIKIDQPTSTSAGQSTDFNDSTPEKISSETKSPLSALLPSLLSRLCVTKNIDATRFCDMMSSLSITFPQLSRNEHVLENYLFIPMVLVIGKLSSSNIKTHHHNMESIYVVVEEAVKRIEEEFPALLDTKEISATAANDVTAAHNLTETPKGNAGGANSDTTATTTGQQACSDVNQGPGGKKNTKKKKKKKVCICGRTSICIGL